MMSDMFPSVATDHPYSVPLYVSAYPANRLCANPACRKRLSQLNKKELCFSCNDRKSLITTRLKR